jgi:hypothetical protein
MSEKSQRRTGLQKAMRSILPEEKHIGVLFDLIDGVGPQYDRMAAVISAPFLEYGLKRCIKMHLKPDAADSEYNYLFSKDDAPYRDFSTLNRLARALSIVRLQEYEHLETIRHIRNTFAHSMDNALTFDHPDIASAIDSLLRPDQEWFDALAKVIFERDLEFILARGRRRIFIMAVFALYWHLLIYNPNPRYSEPLLKFVRDAIAE